ncbi:MAG: FAD binding domain-containing protein [Candidatus Eisenbacteria bacterium]|nr:FAD binding domain-containing protein [Candidatus Eisenbacteria bacterium]
MSRILPRLERYHRPTRVDEAIALLRAGGRTTMLLGGGVSLGMLPRPNVREVVGMERLGVDQVRREDSVLCIGASVTLGRLDSELIMGSAAERLLRDTVRRTATTPLRNLMTVGGVIAGVGPWSDLPVSLLALGADLVLNGAAVLPIETFLAKGPRVLDGALITQVRVSWEGVTGGAFLKVGRNETDLALASASVVVFREGMHPRIRAAIGGLVPRPVRIPAMEDTLAGPPLDGGAMTRLIGSVVSPRMDPRADGDYRLALAGTCVVDCYEAARREACR